MIKTALKHYIAEICIETFFYFLEKNLIPPRKLKAGDKLRYLKVCHTNIPDITDSICEVFNATVKEVTNSSITVRNSGKILFQTKKQWDRSYCDYMRDKGWNIYSKLINREFHSIREITNYKNASLVHALPVAGRTLEYEFA